MRHEKALVFLVAALTVAGIAAYTTIPAAIFPTMTFARIDVVADVGDLPPDQVRVAVALPLERAFAGLPSVTRVLTTSAQGSAEFVIEFDRTTSVQTDLAYVNQAIAQTTPFLPPETAIQANIINPNNEPIVSYALVSDRLSQTLLHELAQNDMVPQFIGAPGLARVTVAGGAQREFHVDLNPAALAADGLTVDDVNRAIADATTINAIGLLDRHYQRQVVLVDAGIARASQLERIPVSTRNGASVPLGSLGAVRLSTAPLTNEVGFDGRHAVILSFYALPGADTVKMADSVAARAAEMATRLPAGVRLRKFWDQTELIKESQRSLRDAILLGALLAIGVIFIFLRNLRMTLVAALDIPLAMAIAIFSIGRLGQTLNLMSVGGLAVAVGLIIDDAIVVVENIVRNRREQPQLPPADLIVRSMQQISSAMIASTATTVVVFVPLVLLSGVSGFFFRALALTLGSALVVSLLLALFVAPVMARWFLGRAPASHAETGFIARLLHGYEPVLRWALSHRRTVFAGSGVVLVATVVLLAHLPSDFLPKLDEGQFEISYVLPVGTSLAASDAAAREMEQIILHDPAVAAVGRWTGLDTNGFTPTPQNAGTLRVKLKPRSRRAGYDTVSSRLRDELAAAVPDVQLDFHQVLEDMINDVSGQPAPLEISVRGADQDELVRLATQISDEISGVRGVTDTFSGVVYTDPTVRIAPDERRLATLGWSTSSLEAALAAGRQGNVAANLPGQFALIPVRVRVADPPAADGAASMLVATPQGPLALASVARVAPGRLATTIDEENGQRLLRVTATISGASLSSVVAGVRQRLAKVNFPPGYSYMIGGEYQEQQRSFREFASVVLIAVALVFFVMLTAFRSYRLPLVILTAIPLALIGVALGLTVTGTPFNVSSFMGLLLLVGIVVKNGILLIDVANRRRHEGATIEDALVVAGRTRLRPIVMTTFAAIGGLFPLALGLGSGAEMEKPLAIAVIGGLSTATAFTLVLIPVLYASFASKESVT